MYVSNLMSNVEWRWLIVDGAWELRVTVVFVVVQSLWFSVVRVGDETQEGNQHQACINLRTGAQQHCVVRRHPAAGLVFTLSDPEQ